MTSKIITSLHAINAIKKGTFVLKSGKTSDIYIDLKSVVSYPSLLTDISYHLGSLINKENNVGIIGVPIGGIPYACNISSIYNIPLLLLRSQKKDYGTQNLIEGCNTIKNIILIEDVITSGKSIMECIQVLEKEGKIVKQIIAIVDREEGGVDDLTKKGYNVTSLFKKSQLINQNSLMEMKVHECPKITQQLLEQSQKKKSNIILAVDLDDADKIINIISKLGEYICAVKIHLDIVKINSNFIENIKKLKEQHSLVIIEDRKFADIGFISSRQLQLIKEYNIVDMVTVHPIVGFDMLAELDKHHIGLLLIHQLSTKNNLIDTVYSNKVKSMAKDLTNFVGFISQEKVDGYLTFTPGISLNSKKGDDMGQTYRDPKDVCSDFYIVGRSIYEREEKEWVIAIKKLILSANR